MSWWKTPKEDTKARVWPSSAIEGLYIFVCPACACPHAVYSTEKRVTGGLDFNGDIFMPTFTGPILHKTEDGGVCRSHIEKGKITYSENCWHNFAGTKHDLPEVGI